MKRLFSFSLQLHSKAFLVIRRSEQDIKNAHMYS